MDNQADDLLRIVDEQNTDTTVNSNDNVVNAIAISTPQLNLKLGLNQTLSVAQLNARGATLAFSDTAIWENNNPQIASVDSAGVVTANEVGSTTITASWRGFEDSIPVTVDDAILQALSTSPVSIEFDECLSAQVNTSALYSDGSSRSLPDAVSWSIVDLNTGSVVPEGDMAIVQASTSGTGSLVLQYEEISLETPIVVMDTLDSITLGTSSYTIPVGSTVEISIFGSYGDEATPVGISGAAGLLEHPLPEEPALSLTQTETGTLELTALTLGTANLNIQCGGMALTQEFEVVPVPTLETITILDGQENDIIAGESLVLSISANYSDGHTDITNTDVEWSLTENDHLAFSLDLSDPEDKQITADESLTFEHQAVLQAQYQGVLTSTNVYALRDVPENLISITMIYSDIIGNEFQLINGSTQTLPVTATLSLALDGEFESGISRIPAADIFWSNSDPAVATVDAEGVVTTLSTGSALISARYREQTVSLPLNVTP